MAKKMSKKQKIELLERGLKMVGIIEEKLGEYGEVNFEELRKREKEELFSIVQEHFDLDPEGFYYTYDLREACDRLYIMFEDVGRGYGHQFSYLFLTEHQHRTLDKEIEAFRQKAAKALEELYASNVVTLLNTSIITSEGTFKYKQVPLEKVHDIIAGTTVQSAIGHQSTADILTELLGVDVPMNRIQYEQKTGDIAIIFKLNGRPPEGSILTREEIEQIGYTFGVLEKLE